MPLISIKNPRRGGFGGRSSGGFGIQWENADTVQAILADVEDGMRTTTNGEMRKGSVQIAKDVLIPALTMSAYSSGVPIAPAMAATMRAKSDRVVTVAVGAVNPKLRGFKSYQRAKGKTTQSGHDANSRSYRTTLAWGSEKGPYPGAKVNHYKVPRNNKGYWVLPGVQAPGTFKAVQDAYADLIQKVIAKYSRYR